MWEEKRDAKEERKREKRKRRRVERKSKGEIPQPG